MRQTCKVLAGQERYREAGQVLQSVLSLVKFSNEEYKNQLKYLSVSVAFTNADYSLAYDSVRYVCSQRPYSIRIWRLFNKIITKAGNFTQNQKVRVMLGPHLLIPLITIDLLTV
jgi:hypothetical protein